MDGGDAGGDLLTVGTDVLDWTAADKAGDTCKALYASDAGLTDLKDEGVPVDAGGDAIGDVGLPGQIVAAAIDHDGTSDGGVNDEAREALIADEEVAASSEDKEREIGGAGEGDGFKESGFGGDFAEEAGGAADAEGGVRGERNLLLYV